MCFQLQPRLPLPPSPRGTVNQSRPGQETRLAAAPPLRRNKGEERAARAGSPHRVPGPVAAAAAGTRRT